MKTKIVLASLTAVALLSGCDPAPQTQYVQESQVQTIQQPIQYAAQPVIVQEHSHSGDLVTGMVIGSMLSGGSGTRTVVQHKTVVVNNYHPARVYVAPARPSSFGSFRRK